MRKKISTAASLALLCASGAFAAEQVITPDFSSRSVQPGESFSLTVNYSTANPANDNLTGLGLRMHWDSSQVTFNDFSYVFSPHLLQQGSPQPDKHDFDNDPATDRFVVVAWTSTDSRWPGDGYTPATLLTADFTAEQDYSGPTNINFTASDTAAGYDLAATPVQIR